MLLNYINAALKKAEYKKLEDGSWFGEIPGFPGVWSNGKTLEACREELIEVLEEWLLLKIRDGDALPVIDGYKISIGEVAGGLKLKKTISRLEIIRKFHALGFKGPYSGGKHQFMKKGSLKVRIPNPHNPMKFILVY